MVFGFFKKKKIDLITPEEVVFSYTFTFNESGILYPYSVQPKTDLDFYWQALEQEGYADLIEWLTEGILYTKNDRVKVFLEELKLYISQVFITLLSREEQTAMLKNILGYLGK